MAFPAAPYGILPNTSRLLFSPSSNCHHLIVCQKQRVLVLKAHKSTTSGLFAVSSESKKQKSEVNIGDNGTAEPARIVLERLFARTQKLEQMMNKDCSLPQNAELSKDLEIWESDLQVALLALRKKEEDLRDAEREVLQKQVKLNETKQDMLQREKDIASACSKQREMEEELIKANIELESKSRKIDEMNILVKQQEIEITSLQSLLSHREWELDNLRKESAMKHEEIEILKLQVNSKEETIQKANLLIKEQETKLKELKSELEAKEHDLAESHRLLKAEQERLQILESDLKKMTAGWLLARDELKEVTKFAKKHVDDIKETSEEFGRVRSLLLAARSELISSQESLASSQRKMQDELLQFNKQVEELDDQKHLLLAYYEKLQAAQSEVDCEQKKSRNAHAQYEELEANLLGEREKIDKLEDKLMKGRSFMEQKAEGLALLLDEIGLKEMEYKHAEETLKIKESELTEARVQIQSMSADMASVQLILQQKDADLLNAQRDLAKVNIGIGELHRLMKTREEQLIQATIRLQEKEEQIEKMSHVLDDSKVKVSEAMLFVQRIVQLTSELVASIKDDGTRVPCLPTNRSQIHDKQGAEFRKKKELEMELLMVKESLRRKKKELRLALSALTVKEEELRASLTNSETSERELKEDLIGDANGNKLHNLGHKWNGEKSAGNLATKKLQIYTADLEAEAALTALQKLADMTFKLANETDRSVTLGYDVLAPSIDAKQLTGSSMAVLDAQTNGLQEAKKEVIRLLTLTEKLVEEAHTGTFKREQ